MTTGKECEIDVKERLDKYQKDDVWLVQCVRNGVMNLEPLALREVIDGFVRHKYGWQAVIAFEKASVIKIGVVRRFLGIPVGVRRIVP